ncbi:MAG: hypothetical protein LBO64_10415 [Desulfovibrio sp.]|jgi:hypothetical protein|nr:hypothetical protein [Desulfovibrio sp.]
MQQTEQIQDGVIDLRQKMPGMSLSEQYTLVHGLPEATEAQRNVKKQALADYAHNSAHGGLVSSTNPEAYNALVDKIAYGDISGPDAVMQLKSDPLAVKVAAADLKKLVQDLEGKSHVKDSVLKEAYLYAIGKDGTPYAGKLNKARAANQMMFIEWARQKVKETNRAKEPDYLKKLAADWVLGGETKGGYGFGYGKDKKQYEAMNDPSWLPDIPAEKKQEIDAEYKRNEQKFKDKFPEYADDVELMKRAFYKKMTSMEVGRRQRPQGGE